jgi:hypothetical protein
MTWVQNHCKKLILSLMICSAILASIYFTKQVQATNKVVTIGEIKLYNEDGCTEVTSYNFPLFRGGTFDTYSKWFFIRNTGKQPLQIRWSITESSIPWKTKIKNYPNGYEHYEGNVCKYSLRIHKDSKNKPDFLAPEKESIILNSGKEARLCFELSYTGKPNTAEKFTLTVSFTATKAESAGNTCNSKCPILNPRGLDANWLHTLFGFREQEPFKQLFTHIYNNKAVFMRLL